MTGRTDDHQLQDVIRQQKHPALGLFLVGSLVATLVPLCSTKSPPHTKTVASHEKSVGTERRPSQLAGLVSLFSSAERVTLGELQDAIAIALSRKPEIPSTSIESDWRQPSSPHPDFSALTSLMWREKLPSVCVWRLSFVALRHVFSGSRPPVSLVSFPFALT